MQPIVTPTPTAKTFPGILRPDDPLVQTLLNIIWALVILLVALIIARYIKGLIVRILARGRVSLNIATLLGNLLNVVVIVVGVITALSMMGVAWTTLLTVLGAAGLALSLAMQDLLKNIIAGIYLLIEQPFRIGQRISVKEVTGVVQGIELRTTILCTDEGLQVVVPNNMVLTEIITNRSASNLQRAVIHVTTRRGSLSNMSGQITGALAVFPATEIATSPTPLVALESVEEGQARLRVEFWTPAGRKVALMPQVVDALRARFPDASITVTS